MPLYEYRCESCDTVFDEYLTTSASPSPPCPECGEKKVERQWGTFGTKWRPSFINWHRMGSWGQKPPKKNF